MAWLIATNCFIIYLLLGNFGLVGQPLFNIESGFPRYNIIFTTCFLVLLNLGHFTDEDNYSDYNYVVPDGNPANKYTEYGNEEDDDEEYVYANQ